MQYVFFTAFNGIGQLSALFNPENADGYHPNGGHSGTPLATIK